MRMGVLDIGSNTGHLLVVDAFRGGPPVPAHSYKEPLRLTDHLDSSGAITEDGVERVGNQRDLLLIAPLVLAVCFVVLIVLLRSLVAPVLLLVINLTSAIAAIGAGAGSAGRLAGSGSSTSEGVRWSSRPGPMSRRTSPARYRSAPAG